MCCKGVMAGGQSGMCRYARVLAQVSEVNQLMDLRCRTAWKSTPLHQDGQRWHLWRVGPSHV